jgi:hypothetical protein
LIDSITCCPLADIDYCRQEIVEKYGLTRLKGSRLEEKGGRTQYDQA